MQFCDDTLKMMMGMAILQGEKWMGLVNKLQNFPLHLLQTKLATAKPEKGVGAGTSKQTLNLVMTATAPSRQHVTSTLSPSRRLARHARCAGLNTAICTSRTVAF